MLKAAKTLRCETCAATAGPKVARPSTIPHMYDFGDLLGIDVFYAHDIDDEKHAFLSVIDYGTSFHAVTRVKAQSGDDIERAFNDLWILPYGAPKGVAVDLEGGLQKGIGRLCDWHNIALRPIATQGHWQAGMVERQGAWWKNIWERVIHELNISGEEVDIVVPIISAAKNDLRRRCGYAPSQWVFGKAPRVPEDLQDPDGGERVAWDLSNEAKFQRQAAMRAAARVAFHKSQLDDRLRRALLQRARTTARPLEVGEAVHFWHHRKDRRRGCWSGPGVIVGKEGGNYWVSKGGRCRLTAPEHLRPASPEEVGEFLVMKGVQREVEQLLEQDMDDPAVYQSDGEDGDPEGGGQEDDDVELEAIGDDAGDPLTEELRPRHRLKRKTHVAELGEGRREGHEAMMLRSKREKKRS